jgi:hypothetical protein
MKNLRPPVASFMTYRAKSAQITPPENITEFSLVMVALVFSR